MRILITAGTVYGRLDDNKLVGNRVRGIWATQFAQYLAIAGHKVRLLVPDTQEEAIKAKMLPDLRDIVQTHIGFHDYEERCLQLAISGKIDAAVMAAAVVNWIPERPFVGKMPTEGVGTRMDIPFILAPRVIDQMQEGAARAGKRLTLVGCKMTSGAPEEEMLEAAYKTLRRGHCNVVVANDLKSGLRDKTLVYPDFTRERFDLKWRARSFYERLHAVLTDKYYRTEPSPAPAESTISLERARETFSHILERYRSRFVKAPGSEHVFGSLGVLFDGTRMLTSPREKNGMFTVDDAVIVDSVEGSVVWTRDGKKATLNAPLLYKTLLDNYCSRPDLPCHAVLHLHECLGNVSSFEYAPPGTIRDSERPSYPLAFDIQDHGFVAVLSRRGDFLDEGSFL